jgi:hypothetical protein
LKRQENSLQYSTKNLVITSYHTATNSTSVMGSNLDRPLGTKKARRQQLFEKLDGHSTLAMRSLDANNRAMQSMDETQRFKSSQGALSMWVQMLMQLGRTEEASALVDIMKEDYEGEKRRPRMEIPEEHKVPSVLMAQKTTRPSPLTVEGWPDGRAEPSNQF